MINIKRRSTEKGLLPMTNSPATEALLDVRTALAWLERWDLQQEHYLPYREARFTVIIDVLVNTLQRPDPLIIDLGIGPGSLTRRIMERLPGATVVGVDEDPLLLGLCASAYRDRRLRLVRADLRHPGWIEQLDLERPADAFVSTTALHWMNRDPLARLMADCARTLAPGGVFVDGDHLYPGAPSPRLDQLTRDLGIQAAERAGVTTHEDWEAWWRAVEVAPELAPLVAERSGGFEHTVTDRPTAQDYIHFLSTAGFAEAGEVWQYGDDRVVVGLMPE